MKLLVVNVGSTSLKFRLFEMPREALLAVGKVERVGGASSPFTYHRGDEAKLEKNIEAPNQRAAIEHVLQLLTDPVSGVLSDLNDLDAVGFKPVHAKGIADAVFITEEGIQAMEEYTPLAPAHNPPYIEAFRIFQDLLPGKPLVGVFEPAFHKTIPDHARTYGIPYEWTEKHAIRRYGFHGASHRYVSHRAPELVGGNREELKIISCHLGGSSSICAIRNGESVDISMGFSPQSGLPNATRNGDLDPFIILYMMEKEGLSTDDIRSALSKNGGLKGISGLSGDVRDLEEAAAAGNHRAALALRVFVHETKKYIGAYTAILEGFDVLAFTGGIGENGIAVRESLCRGLECLGIHLDPSKNNRRGEEGIISRDGSPVQIVVVLANEELVIARETFRLVSGS
ncbi:MAG: acetate/propionate family kinase [Armatimonadetes bacterium]|nr:acetate/propionate family kinase [Armatimonadota bacterium]